MTSAIETNEFENFTVNTDQEFVAANVAKMFAAIGEPPASDMTDEELAATGFEPWQHEDGEWTPPSNEEWGGLANPHLIMVRVAWHMLHKTKEQLTETAMELSKKDEGETNLFVDTLDNLIHTSHWFKGMLTICDAAMARLAVAGLNVPDTSAS